MKLALFFDKKRKLFVVGRNNELLSFKPDKMHLGKHDIATNNVKKKQAILRFLKQNKAFLHIGRKNCIVVCPRNFKRVGIHYIYRKNLKIWMNQL